MKRSVWVVSVVALVAVAATVGYVVLGRRAGLPSTGTPEYEQASRQFYRGLSELQVGLLDVAVQSFSAAAATAPGEPATWANLGLAQLRLGDLEAAAPAIDRASALAPSNGAVAFLKSRLETSRGRRDEAIAQMRRAVQLDGASLPLRMALMQEVEDAAGPNADAEAQDLLDAVFAREPANMAVLIERARLAAKRGDSAMVRDTLGRMASAAKGWPGEVAEQFAAVQRASARSDMAAASREIAFLRNTLAADPAYREGRRLVMPSAELIADPFRAFLRLPASASAPDAPDLALTYTAEPLAAGASASVGDVVALLLDDEQPPALFVVDGAAVERVDRPGVRIAIPIDSAATSPPVLLAVDWNNDFRLDLVVASGGGVRIFTQAADGSFADGTPRAAGPTPSLAGATGVWAADVEMDGDLDLIVGLRDARPVVLRNNADGTWQATRPFDAVSSVRAFVWGDLDGDGDPDAAVVDGSGALHLFANQQAGQFQPVAGPDAGRIVAAAIGDVDADGRLDLVTLDTTGVIRRASRESAAASSPWRQDEFARQTGATTGGARLLLADLDNNGATDVIASSANGTGIWLAGGNGQWSSLGAAGSADISGATDLDGDGVLDLIGRAGGRPARLLGKGTRGYHHQIIRPRAQAAAGDQRINAFGLGGDIETRSGLLVQRQTIDGPTVHVGLGTRTVVDVTRIVWPNGVLQADFDTSADRPIVAQQRLKGSCPWVFADDGTGMRFVTDFLWRSPLGLRINAVDTAGVTQTEDWVRIRGDQLRPRNGAYDVRISAELWETHFVDHASLLVVDHPNDVQVFVDERFAREAPSLSVHAMRAPQPVAQAFDQAGRDVTALVRDRDARFLDTFERGVYQGVGSDHFVEIELAQSVSRDAPSWLVAEGWIYPTDSSINMAIGQGKAVQPRGLSLEVQDPRGRWVVVAPDLGFPAGKNKTVLIDLSQISRAGLDGARRLRLRTNLEIYWDRIGVAVAAPDAPIRTVRVAASRADLRYRGFSTTQRESRTKPEIPVYERVANTAPRWRDLVGFYTRFGDVRELLATTDDRYVIMNAGDELRLSFAAPGAAANGWARDFVLIGDGWVKDGDYNTTASQTVLPLPRHGHPAYESAAGTPALVDEAVYQQHRADWRTYHTRFVAPDDFLAGLR